MGAPTKGVVFADTHARIGLLPAWGQMARLPAAVGTRAAALLRS
jgi:enoyl-CoA hydratase/carnithine racemase